MLSSVITLKSHYSNTVKALWSANFNVVIPG